MVSHHHHFKSHGFHKDERKRQLNVLRNQHHFRKSDEELQALRNELKKQRYHKKVMMERRNSESEESEYRRQLPLIFTYSNVSDCVPSYMEVTIHVLSKYQKI